MGVENPPFGVPNAAAEPEARRWGESLVARLAGG
jgi:hypothetical protein